MSSAMSWPELRASNLSYNNIQHLDESLVPASPSFLSALQMSAF